MIHTRIQYIYPHKYILICIYCQQAHLNKYKSDWFGDDALKISPYIFPTLTHLTCLIFCDAYVLQWGRCCAVFTAKPLRIFATCWLWTQIRLCHDYMGLTSSYAFMMISCSSVETKEAVPLSLFAIVAFEDHEIFWTGTGTHNYPDDWRLVRINKTVWGGSTFEEPT